MGLRIHNKPAILKEKMRALWLYCAPNGSHVMSKRLWAFQQTSSSFYCLAQMLLLALIVILSTPHSLGSSGCIGCVLEHSEHQTQIGTKSHYFSAGCIMGQVGERERERKRHFPTMIEQVQKTIRILIAPLTGSQCDC